MDQNKERNEQKTKPETRDPQKPKRFQLVRLEERIAPASSSGQAGVFPNSMKTNNPCIN